MLGPNKPCKWWIMILDIWNIDQLPVGLLAQLVDALTLGVRVFPARAHLAHWQEILMSKGKEAQLVSRRIHQLWEDGWWLVLSSPGWFKSSKVATIKQRKMTIMSRSQVSRKHSAKTYKASPQEITEQCMVMLKRFVVLIYDRKAALRK